jgi:predicted Zn-dependent protease
MTALSGLEDTLAAAVALREQGEDEEALHILDRGVAEVPGSRDLEVFRAMALYNVGRAKEACESLLRLLVETTSDTLISRYRAALDEYAADLDRNWA